MMGTTSEKLSAILESKKTMQNAISTVNSFISLSDKFSQWPDDLTHIQISGQLQPYQFLMAFGSKSLANDGTMVNDTSAYAYNMKSIEFSDDTVFSYYSCQGMCQGSQALTSLRLPVKIHHVNANSNNPAGTFQYAFQYCNNLSGSISVDISDPTGTYFNSSPISQICNRMFRYCQNISGAYIAFPSYLSGNANRNNYSYQMFDHCSGLKNAVIRGCVGQSQGAIDSTFSNCTSLTSLEFTDMSSFTTNNVLTNVNNYNFPQGCTNLSVVRMPSLLSCTVGSASSGSINSPWVNIASSLKDLYLDSCEFISPGSFANLSCIVHLKSSIMPVISQLPGYEDNFTWTNSNGSSKNGNVTLQFDL